MRIAIIGGGAAGYFGAISAATNFPTANVTLYEATQKPLAKVRISGGGRCNVTHHCFDPVLLCKNYPRGAKELRGPFSRFQPLDTIDWFERHGVTLKTESDGRMFPTTDNSNTIVSCLQNAALEAGVDIQLGQRVKSIAVEKEEFGGNCFALTLHDGSQLKYDIALLTTGSSPRGYDFANNLGHSLVPCVPSLFTFKIRDERLEGLAGVSFASVNLELKTGEKRALKQSGPALITHWGLSGPAVLKLSAWGARALHENHYRARLSINFLPNENETSIRNTFSERRQGQPRKRVSSDNPVAVPNRYWKRIVELSGVDVETTWANITAKAISAIIGELTGASFLMAGKGVFKEEFVTCGGIKLSEVDFKTMESKVCPGLYFAGEILDIDGITGGFNFQNAWTTAAIAGNSIGATETE